jgi:hypothetical protein
MPAEAIHLSALSDCLAGARDPIRRMVPPSLVGAARVGALLVDLPYFDRFAAGLVRYVVGLPQATPSRWGDVLHGRAPILLGVRLGEAGVALARQKPTAEAGQYLGALALGYISHAALDTAIHPLVNRLAAQRALALGDTLAHQHTEVEKFHSILFHEQRNGVDFMGTEGAAAHNRVDFSPLVAAGPVRDALHRAMTQVLGEVPTRADFLRWTRGYALYLRALASWIGKRVAPPAAKERERPAVFDAVGFPRRFEDAVGRSRRWMELLAAYLTDGACDAPARAALFREIPEQTLDPGPEQE